MIPSALWQDCIAHACGHEVGWPRDPVAAPLQWGVHHGDPPPFNRLRGPVHARGGVSGVVWQHGRELLAWGEPERADLSFSVAKTYLGLLAGVAHGQGLLPNVDEPVGARVSGIGFDQGPQRLVSWRHLLEQTSEWEGSCFGLPDTLDRWRKVPHDPRPAGGPKGGERPLGASEDRDWRGYDDAWVDIAGRRMPSVPGGSHWGGGISISARDQARLGQLMLADGLHEGRQLIPRHWVQAMKKPSAVAPFYGWLVVRWLDGGALEGFMQRARAALAAH